jgi:2-polyprenyl-6-methoxyphenol hydroxylase-like FAD-dependent oxidoreductase
MQRINFLYRDTTGRLLILGDAAHAMVPTLGQGATIAIEYACVAAQEIISAVSHSRSISHLPVDVALLTERIEHRCLSRSNFVSATSEKATEHLRGGNVSLEGDVRDWTSEESSKGESGYCFRKAMREVWRNYPKSCTAPDVKILPQHIA